MQTRETLKNMPPYVAGERRPGVIKLASNENPLGPSPRAQDAIRAAIDDMHIYPDGSVADLRAAIARSRGVSPDMVIPGNGSDEVLTMIAGTYLDPGDRVLIGAHTFSQYAFSARLFDASIQFISMPKLTLTPRAILESAAQSASPVKAVFICTPNNPTGLAWTQAELEELLEGIDRETLVVIDHAYQDYATSPEVADAASLIGNYPNLIALYTFSKIYGLAAARVGYGLASPERIAEIERVRLPFNINGLAKAAAIAALDDRAFVQRSREVNNAGKARLDRILTGLEIPYLQTEANFMCIDAGMDAREAAEIIAAEGTTVRPLNSFGLPRHIRITVGTDDQIDVLEKGLHAMADRSRRGG